MIHIMLGISELDVDFWGYGVLFNFMPLQHENAKIEAVD